MNGLENGQDVSTLENKREEITLAPSNFQLFLVCLAILALLGAFFAAGYNAGKRASRAHTARLLPDGSGFEQGTNFDHGLRVGASTSGSGGPSLTLRGRGGLARRDG
jgi:hypothetical protein